LVGGDFNKDGNIDLVTAHWMPYGLRDFINVHLGNGDGFFQEEVVIKVGQGPRWLVTTDFNADGILDLATGNTGADGEGRETMTVLFGTGTGNFVGRTDYYVPFSPDLIGTTGLAAADHDRDGDIDILMTTVAGGVVVYLNDGSGGFSSQPRIGLSWDPWSITVADVTRDGVPDLVSITSDGTSGLSKALSVLPGKASAPTGVEVIYCTAKVNSCGTLPAIGFAGAPSATAGSGFDVRAKNAGAAKCGLVIYGDSGRANPPLPFLGGLICISTPIRRSVAVCDSSGTPPGCDGTLSIDMNAFATGALGGNPLPSLTMPGTQVNCQFWGRDTVANGALLTAALEYFVGP
jgi:hypothetical protein